MEASGGIKSGDLPGYTPISDLLGTDEAKKTLTAQAATLTKADLIALNTTGPGSKDVADLDLGYEDLKSVADAFAANYTPEVGLKAVANTYCCCCAPCCCCTAVSVTTSIVAVASG